jgi:hypothetical protein
MHDQIAWERSGHDSLGCILMKNPASVTLADGVFVKAEASHNIVEIDARTTCGKDGLGGGFPEGRILLGGKNHG